MILSLRFFSLCLCVSVTTLAGVAAAQEPRLPPPALPGVTLQALDARAASEPDLPIDARVARAQLLSAAGRYPDSAAAWLDIVAREPLLAAFARAEAIRSLLDAGDSQSAQSIIAQVPEPVPTDILLRAAAAARTAGMLDRAAALYQQARDSAGRSAAADQAGLGLAATFEEQKNAREALDVYRELELTFRQAGTFDAAESAAKRLADRLGDSEPLSEQDYETIADRLQSVAAFKRAIAVLEEWRRRFPNTTHDAQIDNDILQSLYALRDNDAARKQAERIVAARAGTIDGAAAARTLFSLDVREGKTADVERRGFALLRGEVPGSSLEQRRAAGRLLAEYLVSVGRPARGLEAYSLLYAMTKDRGDRIDLSWRIAIANLRAGNRAKAVAGLRRVRRLKLDSETDRATTFWLAYALDASGAHVEARRLWRGLVDRFPFSYYGVRAESKLGVSVPAPELTFPQLSLRPEIMAHPDYQVAAMLSRAGLASAAASYARRLSNAFRRDAAVALLAARAAADAGQPSATATIMSAFFGEYLERPARGLPPDFWELAYPPAYLREVAVAAERHHVDPLLMIALARQESHFERGAMSPVGAIGLFQIMPSTAAELDPSFVIEHAETELVKPDVSAELAAKHLEQNAALFDGALAPMIASYNADKERVQVWWAAAKGSPEELFVDSIPYRETRSYVRQVLANYAMYQRSSARSSSPQK